MTFLAFRTSARTPLLLLAVACLFLLIAASSELTVKADQLTYLISVNTESVSKTSGFLNLQFNPGGPRAQSATASINNFALAGGSLADSAETLGEAAGLLPRVVTINNSEAFNDYFQGITFGSSFNFTLTLGGAAVEMPNNGLIGNAFALLLYGPDAQTSVLSTDQSGELLRIALKTNGTGMVINYGASVVVDAAPVPEPTTMLLLGTGLAGVLAGRRRCQR